MSNQNPTSSGIQPSSNPVEGLKATMKLTRDMGMAQQRKRARPEGAPAAAAPAAPASAPAAPAAATAVKMLYAIATPNSVSCPKCRQEYEITPEAYGVVAECAGCACEFQIQAPAVAVLAAKPQAAGFSNLAAAAGAQRPAAPAAPQKAGLSTTDMVIIGSIIVVALGAVIAFIVIVTR